MAKKPRIGQYRHTAVSQVIAGVDGTPRHTLVRRRFPFRGLVFLAHGLLGPLVCGAVPPLLRGMGLGRLLPQHANEKALPPSPGINNLLFCIGLAGFWLWSVLWKTRLSPERQARGVRGTFPALLGQALILGPLLAFVALPIGVMGWYIRDPQVHQPWFVKPFFAVMAAPVTMMNWLVTGIIPLMLILLGLLLGVSAALGVALMWQQFPEEPVLK